MRPSLLRASAFAMVSMFLMPTIAWADPILVSWATKAKADLSYADLEFFPDGSCCIVVGQATGGFLVDSSSPNVGAEASLSGNNNLVTAQLQQTGTLDATGLTASGFLFGQVPTGGCCGGDGFNHAIVDGSFSVSLFMPTPHR